MAFATQEVVAQASRPSAPADERPYGLRDAASLPYARTISSDGAAPFRVPNLAGLSLGSGMLREQVQARLFGLTGPKIGRFEIERTLGRGGMGEVYLAHDPKLGRRVALKVLRAQRRDDAQAHARARREAWALALVDHPNVVRVLELGEHDRQPYVAMEYIEGRTLRSWLRAGERCWRDVVEVLLAAGRGLWAAHRVGLVHRDFKADNVLVSDEGERRRVCVIDFGIVSLGDDDDGGLSQPGMLLGTPQCMSPEQLAGRPVSAASDQFSFCLALYRALWANEPFAGDSVLQRLVDMEADQPVAPCRGHACRSLWPIVRRGLACDPRDRWPSMAELLAALEREAQRCEPRSRLVFELI